MTCLSKSLLIVFLLISFLGYGQNSIYEIGSLSDDRLDEWYIVSDDDIEGKLETKWKLRDDWNEWEYEIGERSGDISLKQEIEPKRWELRSNEGIIVQMTQSWRNDKSEWKIECEGIQLSYEMPHKNDIGLWQVDDKEMGYFECITLYERDYRDWEIYDEMSEEIILEMKLAMAFISILPNLPGG